jgi:hypothetical protein
MAMHELCCFFSKQIHASFYFEIIMSARYQSIDSKIISRIYGHGRGWVFTPADFHDLGSRNAIALALMRYTRTGTIRQLARGLYDYPRQDRRLGFLSASTDDIAKALSGRDNLRLQASGAHAANLLGLSTQVPIRAVYLTDGRSRKVQLGKRQIILKHTTTRQMATAGRTSGLVIQALRWLGQRNVDDSIVGALRNKLSDNDKQQLLKDLRYAPAWVADTMRKVAQPQHP